MARQLLVKLTFFYMQYGFSDIYHYITPLTTVIENV